jgi:hypothetical protein
MKIDRRLHEYEVVCGLSCAALEFLDSIMEQVQELILELPDEVKAHRVDPKDFETLSNGRGAIAEHLQVRKPKKNLRFQESIEDPRPSSLSECIGKLVPAVAILPKFAKGGAVACGGYMDPYWVTIVQKIFSLLVLWGSRSEGWQMSNTNFAHAILEILMPDLSRD